VQRYLTPWPNGVRGIEISETQKKGRRERSLSKQEEGGDLERCTPRSGGAKDDHTYKGGGGSARGSSNRRFLLAGEEHQAEGSDENRADGGKWGGGSEQGRKIKVFRSTLQKGGKVPTQRDESGKKQQRS